MKTIVVGLGIQGKKRVNFLQDKCMGTVDVISDTAKYKSIYEVPINKYDAAYVCTPDYAKQEILEYLLNHNKHILVEKPILSDKKEELNLLKSLAEYNKISLYTAYNHRFEPHIKKIKELIDSKELGKVYYCKIFYGNGTAQDIKNSLWRSKTYGVLTDLGSHLLDLLLYWYGNILDDFKIISANCFEANTYDYVAIHSEKYFPIDLEMSYICWKNNFTCDFYFEKGSAHIKSLCKWGSSKFTVRKRKYPSGVPSEETIIISKQDPTWEEEQKYFWKLCSQTQSNISNDIIINNILQNLIKQVAKNEEK